ncbi:homoserine kinase [Candidatus Poribacteria bacterium]|nr:homoserine kinase [Candidatus Poribacteria bacterium]
MAQYTTLTSTQLANIVSHYDIGTSVKLEEMSGGYGNSNFKLTTSEGVFLLKICDEKTTDELQLQISLLAHLQEHGYPTPYPIPQKNGESLHLSQDLRVIIYPFLNGGTPQPSQCVLKQIGEALARLHQISPLMELPRFPMGLSQIVPFIEEIKETEFRNHPFVLWLKSELEWMMPILVKPLPSGLLHGDLFLDNTLIDGEKMVTIIDFEEGCHDTLLIDIGMTIIGCCYTKEHELDVGLVHSFLKAYNNTRPISDEEFERLDCYVHYAALTIAFWRFRQFNIRRPDKNSADKYQEMIIRSCNWETLNT